MAYITARDVSVCMCVSLDYLDFHLLYNYNETMNYIMLFSDCGQDECPVREERTFGI